MEPYSEKRFPPPKPESGMNIFPVPGRREKNSFTTQNGLQAKLHFCFGKVLKHFEKRDRQIFNKLLLITDKILKSILRNFEIISFVIKFDKIIKKLGQVLGKNVKSFLKRFFKDNLELILKKCS